MGILRGLLSKPGEGILEEEDELPHPYAGAEAALDEAIKQRKMAATDEPIDWTKLRTGEDRRKNSAPRPGGLPDRRSGADRRSGIDRRGAAAREFGRRSPRVDS